MASRSWACCGATHRFKQNPITRVEAVGQSVHGFLGRIVTDVIQVAVGYAIGGCLFHFYSGGLELVGKRLTATAQVVEFGIVDEGRGVSGKVLGGPGESVGRYFLGASSEVLGHHGSEDRRWEQEERRGEGDRFCQFHGRLWQRGVDNRVGQKDLPRTFVVIA